MNFGAFEGLLTPDRYCESWKKSDAPAYVSALSRAYWIFLNEVKFITSLQVRRSRDQLMRNLIGISAIERLHKVQYWVRPVDGTMNLYDFVILIRDIVVKAANVEVNNWECSFKHRVVVEGHNTYCLFGLRAPTLQVV